MLILIKFWFLKVLRNDTVRWKRCLTRSFACLRNCCLRKIFLSAFSWNQGYEILENCNSVTIVLKILGIFFSKNAWFTSWFYCRIPYNCYFRLPCQKYLKIMKNCENGKTYACYMTQHGILFQIGLTLSCGGPYHIETSPLICRTDQRIGFCIIVSFVIKELKNFCIIYFGYFLTRNHSP